MIPWLGYIFHISSLQSYSLFPSLYIIFRKILAHTAHIWVVRSDAPKSSGLLTCIICNSSAWELCLFYILFIQSFIYISMNSWLFILYPGLKSDAVAAAAAAAKSLQSCLTLCDPTDGSPPGSPVPGILQARTLECVAISFSNVWKWKVKVKSLSRVRLPAIPWTAAYQAPPSMGLSRQEYWSGVPLPMLLSLFCDQIVSDLATGALSLGSYVHFDIPLSLWYVCLYMCVWILPCLEIQGSSGSSCMFPVSVLKSAILQGVLIYFTVEWT